MFSHTGALVAAGICTGSTSLILILRFVGTLYLHQQFDVSCALVATSIIIAISRGIIDTRYLNYGTAGELPLTDRTSNLSAQELSRIKTGTILAIVARILVTTFYWLQVSLLLLFYSRFLPETKRWKIVIRLTWLLIVLTYIVVLLATYLECRPFRLYWQISPPPGQCTKAYIQLFAQGICNITIDLVLLGISFPILVIKQLSTGQRIRLGLLYSTGFFCIAVTGVRIALTKSEHSLQQDRSVWASIQEAVSAFVANAPTVYGNWRVSRRRSELPTLPLSPQLSWAQMHNPLLHDLNKDRRYTTSGDFGARDIP